MSTQPAMPFGLGMGMKRSELAIESELQPWLFKLSSVPKPHPQLESYYVRVGPESGLYWVKGVGPTFPADGYGRAVIKEVEALQDQVAARYGPPLHKFDHLSPGSIWGEPREWMQGLRLSERHFAFLWTNEDEKRLVAPLSTILVSAFATDTDSASIFVEFVFENNAKAEREIAVAVSDVF